MRPLSIIDATPDHFSQIVALERETSASSLVTLTEGHALHEARERGHAMLVALEGDTVAGWIWLSMELGRGGEYVGRILRLAVRASHAGGDAGERLLERAGALLSERGCASVHATLDAGDEATRGLLAAAGFTVDSVTMGRRL